jgi:hypothetical protein
MKSIAVLVVSLGLCGCAERAQEPVRQDTQPAAAKRSAPVRQAFFGDLHLHTTYSFDAWGMMGARTTPDEAYRFAKGESVTYLGRSIQRREPLDFMAVTDHSEFLGVLNQLDLKDSELGRTELGRKFMNDPKSAFTALVRAMGAGQQVEGLDSAPYLRSTWDRIIEAANTHYVPGRFTTFIGYEWTSMLEGKYNLHRNVIFSADRAPLPFTALDSQDPERLWDYLEKLREQGTEVIAVPHNSNASGGLMFDWVDSSGKPIDEAYARRRAQNEPLMEIAQVKGQSETVPELSSNDELADFEVMDRLMTVPQKSEPRGSYARDALGRGLVIAGRTGANPYKLGFVGGTDIHNGLSTSAEADFAGGNGGTVPDMLPAREEARRRISPSAPMDMLSGKVPDANQAAPFPVYSGALTGVWAEENTRPSIYAALRRKETFGTSGTRLQVRLFGGWSYTRALLNDRDWLAAAYDAGVPMGGDLPVRPTTAAAPSFVVHAAKDPNGANLDRLQIVKVWLEGDAYREQVFDVAASDGRAIDARTGRVPPLANTVDLKTATYRNTVGAAQLSAVWTDPAFDAATPALYYLRAIEIHTPRWTTLLAVARDLPIPQDKPPTLQERAWSSPIWYTPNAGAAATTATARE